MASGCCLPLSPIISFASLLVELFDSWLLEAQETLALYVCAREASLASSTLELAV